MTGHTNRKLVHPLIKSKNFPSRHEDVGIIALAIVLAFAPLILFILVFGYIDFTKSIDNNNNEF